MGFIAEPPTERACWLWRHCTDVVGSAIATHIAFQNFGLRLAISHDYAGCAPFLAWFGPTLVAIGVTRWLNCGYGRAGTEPGLGAIVASAV